jgi:RNA-splicing ligase RtcB
LQVTYLVDRDFIPDDGSEKVIARFVKGVDDKSEAVLYPDVHYKKGARTVNGLLIASKDRIFPAMLGVANCGFTFGRLDGVCIEQKELLSQAFETYSRNAVAKPIPIDRMRAKLAEYISLAYRDQQDQTFSFCGVDSHTRIEEMIDAVFPGNSLRVAAGALGTLGGGNHFFELHRVDSIYSKLNGLRTNDIIFILHTDSGAAGDIVNLTLSNLSELGYLKGIVGAARRFRMRLSQARYFMLSTKLFYHNFLDSLKLLFSKNDLRYIPAHSILGKHILLAFAIAAAIGEMNRDQILKDFMECARTILPSIRVQVFESHSHDSLSVEKHGNEKMVVHRNGVQRIGKSSCFVLPGALGTESYLFKNTGNAEAYLSANHGTGRLLDKHLARSAFKAGDTEAQLKNNNVALFRRGRGNLAEQHPGAFKNVLAVAEMMEKYDLGKISARLLPMMAMKG